MSQRETKNVAYGEFKGFWVAIHNQTQVTVICTRYFARPFTVLISESVKIWKIYLVVIAHSIQCWIIWQGYFWTVFFVSVRLSPKLQGFNLVLILDSDICQWFPARCNTGIFDSIDILQSGPDDLHIDISVRSLVYLYEIIRSLGAVLGLIKIFKFVPAACNAIPF